MQYNPIRTRWIVCATVIIVLLSTACEMAAGNSLSFPRSLWWVPDILLYPLGVGLMMVLIDRYRKWRLRDASSDSK